MKVIINGSLNVNNSGGTTVGNSSSSITANTYSRVNKNGSINISTDPRFNAPYPTNLSIYGVGDYEGFSYISSVTIGGGPNYIIQQGTFPVYADPNFGNTALYAHHFGGTSITVERGVEVIYIYKNGIEQGGSTCNNPTGNFINGTLLNFTFTETDIIIINGNDCGA
jgi:hypothetical protein